MTLAKNQEENGGVTAFEADRTIRELIGEDADLTQIFSQENIDACQKVIDDGRGAFFGIAYKDLLQLEALVQDTTAAAAGDVAFDDIARLAADMTGHAELYGFGLIATIGNHIADYCEPGAYAPAMRRRLIGDLVKMLRLAIKNKISDDRGALSHALRASLRRY